MPAARGSQPSTEERRRPWTFCALVVVLSLPFLVLGEVAGLPDAVPINLPASAFMFVCPIVAAAILVHRGEGPGAVRRLAARAADWRRIPRKRWLIPALVLMPSILAVEYGLLRLLGAPLPEPVIPPVMVPVFFLAFFLPAVCEEVGWQGYAFDPLQARYGALVAALALGTVWAVWHAVPYVQGGNPPAWVAGQIATTVALRVLIAWVYSNAGQSVFSAVVFHDTVNVAEFLFPNYSSAYDPVVAAVLTTAVAAVVVFLWGARTLARYRFAGPTPAGTPRAPQ